MHSVNHKARTVPRSTSEDAGISTPTSRPRYPQQKHRSVPPAPCQGKTTPLAAKGRESREPLTGMCTRSMSFFWLEPLLPLPEESFFLVSMAVLPIPSPPRCGRRAQRGGLFSTYPHGLIGRSYSVLLIFFSFLINYFFLVNILRIPFLSLLFIFNFFLLDSSVDLFFIFYFFLHFRGFNLKKKNYYFFYSFVRAFLSVCVRA